ncbi:MAG: hypothetical protein COX07_05635 [Bacteroidetes bacterium CG23_combo_of_CG06-09_8_20_14_all_32_9]|nr:MAG: hypothetical protein COX07_05635 [Bacteroidetes bacterium CG23_combo_of_CG06-09_8_20_14_all_32_9]
MKSDLLRQFRNLFKEDKVRLNKRVLIFFLFVALSTFIWLLHAIDKEYVTEINYPVNYFNFPENRIETIDLPNFFTLKVEASGYLLLKQKIGKTLYPLQIDILKYLPELLLRDTIGFTIKTTTFRETIENQLSQQIRILEINPESIRFLFASKVSKVVLISPQLKYALKKQLVIKDEIVFYPKKVSVSGPVNILDTLSKIPTVLKDFGVISGSVSKNLLLKPIKNLTYSPNNVDININVEEYTESSIEIPITVLNLPDSIKIQLLPEKVKIYYCTGLSTFNYINPSQFLAVINYNEIKNSTATKFTVLIKEFPDHVFNLRVNPRTVDFIIKTKK